MAEIVGYNVAHSGGTTEGTSLTLPVPSGTVSGDGLVLILIANVTDTSDWSVPPGWTRLEPLPWTAIGTMKVGLYTRNYTGLFEEVVAEYGPTPRHLNGAIVSITGGAPASSWVIGEGKERSTAPTETTTITAPPVTLTFPDTFVLTVAVERTTANEVSVSATGATETFFAPQVGEAISTIWVGERDYEEAGTSDNVVITYPNPQTHNGMGMQIAIPPKSETPGTSGGVWNGSYLVPITNTLSLPPVYTVEDMLEEDLMYWAHRGGSANWSEMTMRAYTNAAWHGAKVLEASVWRSNDGVFVLSHDRSTLRTTGTDIDIPTNPYSEVEGLPVTEPVSGGVTGRLEELLRAYGHSHVILLDDKQGIHLQDMLDLAEEVLTAEVAKRQIMLKFYGNSGGATAAEQGRLRGYESWGFLYSEMISSMDPEDIAKFTLVGMSWDAPQGDFDALLSEGKRVIAHIVNNQTQASTALGKGATGLQCGNVLSLIPRVNILPG